MKGSVARRVADYIDGLPPRSFVTVRDVEGPRGGVETSFSRLAAAGVIERIRKGLYWKGMPTPIGMSRPRIEEVALELGGPGSGPAGVAAAHWLGLTTQVPSTFLTAVPKRVPEQWGCVKFSQRPVSRLLNGLTPSEVAVLEVLHSGPAVIEVDWRRVGDVVADLEQKEEIRSALIDTQVADEPDRAARARWSELRQLHPRLKTAA